MQVIKAVGYLLFGFRGRISLPMWWFGKFLCIVYLLVWSLIGVLLDGLANFVSSEDLVAGISFLFFMLSLIWSSTVLNVKRFHDHDMSGSHVVIGFIPVIGFFYNLVYLGVWSGRLEDNSYGPPPPQSPREWWAKIKGEN